MTEPQADLLHIFFGLIKKAVQAHRSVVMSGRAERSEAEANVETGLAHRAVALVIVRTEFELARVLASRGCHGCWNITDLQRIRCSGQRLSGTRRKCDDEMIGLIGMKEEVCRNL